MEVPFSRGPRARLALRPHLIRLWSQVRADGGFSTPRRTGVPEQIPSPAAESLLSVTGGRTRIARTRTSPPYTPRTPTGRRVGGAPAWTRPPIPTGAENRYVVGGNDAGRTGRRRRRAGRGRRRRRGRRQSGGRHGSRRTGLGRGRALEAHPAEHVHAMGQRAPQGGRHGGGQPGDGPGRRAPADCAHRGAQRQAAAQAQQAADVPVAEAGERVGGVEVPRGREHQAGQHR